MESMRIPVSAGEVIDKLSILAIKSERLRCNKKKMNVQHELMILQTEITKQKCWNKSIQKIYKKLLEVNKKLWDVEDKLRHLESLKKFDSEFLEAARSVYRLNDKRSLLKREINLKLNSSLIEEKSYEPY